jgi:hypothetical protein
MSSPQYYTLVTPPVGSAAAGANEAARLGMNHLPVKLVVEDCKFVCGAAVTAADANNGVLTVKIGATTIGTLTTDLAQGDLVAGTAYTIALSASGEDLVVDVNEVYSVTKTYNGTGAVMSGIVSLRCSEIRS